MRHCLLFVTLAALVSPSWAQGRSWALPRPSAVLYDHTVEIQRHGTCELSDEVLEETLFGDARNAAVLLQGELDPRQQYIQVPLTDLRDLPFLLATDLRRAGGGKLELTLCPRPPFPTLVVRVEYGKRDSEGMQQIFATLEPEPGQAMSQVAGLRGTLAITRQLDPEKPVTSALSLFDLELGRGPSGLGGLGLIYQESWEWAGVVQPGDARFRALVRAAIAEHVQCLRGRLEGRGGRARGGQLALRLLALLKAGEDPEDPLIAAALAQLCREQLTATYDLSLAIMVIEALYTPPAERQMLLEGRLRAPMPREVSEPHRQLLQQWTSTLLGNIDTRVDPGYRWRWNYVPAARYDNSNTQFALLGLYAAHLCGIDIPTRVWEGAAAHWLDDAMDSTSGSLRLDLTSYEELHARERGRHYTKPAPSEETPRGWAYTGGGQPYGSMTVGGISSLVVCRAVLGEADRKKLDQAIDGGFAWLARNLTVRTNPEELPSCQGSGRRHRWSYYYLYGLERACELAHVARVQGRDWYLEGALQIIRRPHPPGQPGHGSFDAEFGLLFLKRAALPVVTRVPEGY